MLASFPASPLLINVAYMYTETTGEPGNEATDMYNLTCAYTTCNSVHWLLAPGGESWMTWMPPEGEERAKVTWPVGEMQLAQEVTTKPLRWMNKN